MIKDQKLGITIYIILFVLILWFVFHTSIISDKNPERMKLIGNLIKKANPKKKNKGN